MIRFVCPSCRRKFQSQDAYAGKPTQCPCGQRFRVPLHDPQGTTLYTEDLPTVQAVPVAARAAASARGRVVWLATILGISLLSCLCGGGLVALLLSGLRLSEPTQADIVAHLRKHGIEGDYSQLTGELVGGAGGGRELTKEELYGPGAVDGGAFGGPDVRLTFAEYRDVKGAENRLRLADKDEALIRVGRIVVKISEGREKVEPILKKL